MDFEVLSTAIFRLVRKNRDVSQIIRRKLHIKTVCFNVHIFSTENSLKFFHFRPRELGKLSDLVNFNGITARRHYRCSPITATCTLLRILAYPSRWFDLELFFGLSSQVLCEVFWEALVAFQPNINALLSTFRTYLVSIIALNYAQFIEGQGAPLPHCIGFISGTKIFMSRPVGRTAKKLEWYSGKKRPHFLNYITITTTDGLLFCMYGPEEGRRHDLTLYLKSELDNFLKFSHRRSTVLRLRRCRILQEYMAPGGVSRNSRNFLELQFNSAMSSAWKELEWSYKDTKQNFTFNDFRRMLKVLQSKISLIYKASSVFWNLKVFLNHGGQVFFALQVFSTHTFRILGPTQHTLIQIVEKVGEDFDHLLALFHLGAPLLPLRM